MITQFAAILLLVGFLGYGFVAILISLISAYKLTPVWEGKNAIKTQKQLQELREQVEESETEYEKPAEQKKMVFKDLTHIELEDLEVL